MQNVHYVPLSWQDEVDLLQRELDRAWSSLKLEEHRNRNLPPQVAASTPEEYDRLADESATKLMAFLDEQQVMPMKDYMEPALRERLGVFIPEDERNFFWIAAHYDPTPLYTHFYHWFDLAQMREEPHASPIRRGALLYNIFDSRNEGDRHRCGGDVHARRPVRRQSALAGNSSGSCWRSGRPGGSARSTRTPTTMTMAEAGTVHVEWTPRGWMENEPELLQFEQHLYLRQPGYGTSYVTGKYLLERLLAHRTSQTEDADPPYTLSDFYGELNDAGNVPISLVHWQLTGNDEDVRGIMEGG